MSTQEQAFTAWADPTPIAALEAALSRYEAIPPAPEDAPSYIKTQAEAKRTRALLEFASHCTPETVRGLLDELESAQKIVARYRWLREQGWYQDTLCVVESPKANVKLGACCPFGWHLDAAIDKAMEATSNA